MLVSEQAVSFEILTERDPVILHISCHHDFIFLEQDISFFWELMALFSFHCAEAGYECAGRNSHAALLAPVEPLLDHLEVL